jgi:ATP-dependent protease ClpP protease subunit
MKDLLLYLVPVLVLLLACAYGGIAASEPRDTLRAMAEVIAPRSAVLSQLRVRALAGGDAELLIYGPIGDSWWSESVTAKSVVEQLQQIQATTIQVRINSEGGSVQDGLAIYNALKRHGARIVVTVDGLAASIASLIAMAGDEVVMPSNTLMMVHAPWAYTGGNATDLREAADVLDTYATSMATSYATKTGKSNADILALLQDGKDHWYTADQAIAFGLADRSTADADEATDDAAAAAALLSYTQAIARAPVNVSAALRRRIQATCTPKLFASMPEATQLAVVANTEDVTMKQKYLAIMAAAAAATVPAPPAADIPAPAAAAPDANAALVAVRERNDRIHAALRDVMAVTGVRDLYETALRDPTMSVEAVQARALTLLGAQGAPANGGAGRVEGGEDARDRFVTGAVNALLARGGLMPRESGNEFNGMTLSQLGAETLTRAGISVRGMSPDQIARRVLASQTTSDFPSLLGNVAGRQLRAAYEAHPNTYQRWCAVGQVSDFKASPRIQLGSFNNLATIPEGGEYTYGNLAEDSETITAATKGKALKLTRQMIVNDDLGGFLRRAMLMGRAAARTVNADAYALLTSGSSNNGPTMSDTGQLFNATAVTTAGGHANYLAAGQAPTVASVSVGRAAMRKQKDKGLREVLNIQPRFLLAPVALEDTSWALLNSTADPASSNSNKANYVRDVARLELITDPYLDSISATGWYLAADPNDAPLIEVDFLDGIQVPYVDEQIDFDTDSLKFKVRLDYGLAAIDWRGGYRNSGTGG